MGALNPWFGIYFMTTGKDAGGDLLLPGQQISRKDALRLYTAANAWFNFEENDMGTIEAGKFADLVVLPGDIMTVPAKQIESMQVLMTMVGGKVVYQHDSFKTSSTAMR